MEVISSAGSDIVLTLVGGKVVKIAWTGSKALVSSAAKLGAKLTAGEVKVVERQFSMDGIGPYKLVGGHHPLQQAAFKGHPLYNAREALAISEGRLAKYGVEHADITAAQRALQKELRDSGRPNTMAEQMRISWQSMEKAGIPRDDARKITTKAFWDLRSQGVKQPTSLPKR